MDFYRALPFLLLIVAVCHADEATKQEILRRRGHNALTAPGFENTDAWRLRGNARLDDTVAFKGKRSLKLSNADSEQTSSAMQEIRFSPPIRHPFRVSGWSKAANVTAGQDYDIYLDVFYDDDTPLWGRIAAFRCGSHDWAKAETVFYPAKPVKRIEVYVFLRKAAGTAWFDDIRVEPLPLEFTSLRVMPHLFGTNSVGLQASASLPINWTARLKQGTKVLGECTGTERNIRAMWSPPSTTSQEPLTVSLEATDTLAGETIKQSRPVPAASSGSDTTAEGYAVWTTDSMEYVLPHDFPPEKRSTEAKISLAGHEYESFQTILLSAPGVSLHDVTVETTDLVRADGAARIDRKNIQWRQVGYVKLDEIRPHPAAPKATPGWWPEMLLPVKRFDVKPDFAQSIWTTIYAPAGTPPGEYRGELIIRPKDREPTRVAIKAEVYGFSLPVQGHLKTAFALMDGFLEKVYGRPVPTELRRKFGDFLLKHRLNPDDISRTESPEMEDLLHYDTRGLNAFNVLNMVEPRGKRTWVCFSPQSVYTPEFKKQLISRLDPVVAELRKTGLIEKAYIYTFDERGEEFFPTIAEYFGMVKKRYPEIPTLTTAYIPLDPKLMKRLNVDWNCPLTPKYDLAKADACRAEGLQVWAYICLGPWYPYANWLPPYPLMEGRVLWWQAYQQKFDGLLYWGVNFWSKKNNDRPIDPSGGPLLDWSITTGGASYQWLHGDGVLLYPGKDGPIGSIRLANIRDGLEDYEYLWLLAKRRQNRDTARKACLPVTTALDQFTRDPAVLCRTRAEIAREIDR